MKRLGEASRQTAVLYVAQLVSMLLNLGFTTVVGRWMSQEDYGTYSFCLFSVIVFLGYLFEFGFFSAGQRLLAIAPAREDERRVLGALTVTAMAIGVLFAVVICVLGPLVDGVLRHSQSGDAPVAGTLLLAAPLAIALPVQLVAEMACQGTNRIGVLAVMRLATPLASLAIVAAFGAAGTLTPLPAITAYLGGYLVAGALALAMLGPSFDVRRSDFARLVSATREFGLNIFAGRVVGMMSLRLDQLLIPFFVGTRRWGAYNIAQRVSEPMTNLSRALATTRFKAFANAAEVDIRLVRWNIALLAAAAAGLAGIGPFAFVLVFPNKYRNALPLFLPFALSAFFGGLFQPYNVFLTAHGDGRALRNIALSVGAANVVGVPLCAYRYGLAGAAWYAVGSMAFNFALHLYYYRKLQKMLSLRSEEHEHDDGDGGQASDAGAVG